jgi:hypothetical protein
VVYVVGLPAFLISTLIGYRHQLAGRKTAPQGLLLGFLVDDYKVGLN